MGSPAQPAGMKTAGTAVQLQKESSDSGVTYSQSETKWALINCKVLFSFGNTNRLETEKKKTEKIEILIYADLKTEEENQNPTQNIRWCGQIFLLHYYSGPIKAETIFCDPFTIIY